MRTTRSAWPVLAAAIALSLAGCSPTGPGEGSSTEASPLPPSATGSSEEGTTCADIRGAASGLTESLERGVNLLATDPAGAAAEFEAISGQIATLEAGASDSNLTWMLGNLRAKLDAISASVSDGVSLDEAGELSRQANELQAAVAELSAYCEEY